MQFQYVKPLMIMFFCCVAGFTLSCSDSSTIEDITVNGGVLGGTVVDQNGAGVPDVTINIKSINGDFSVETDENGNFSISMFEGGSYILSPVLGGGSFEPSSITEALSGSDITDLTFTLTSCELAFEPLSPVISGVEETCTVDIDVNYISKLISAQLVFEFDPSVVEVTEINTSGDGFMLTDAGVFVIELINDVDNVNGTVSVSIGGLKNNYTGVSGNGKIVSFTLKGKKAGTSPLTFKNGTANNIILHQYLEGGEIGVGVYFKTDAVVTVK